MNKIILYTIALLLHCISAYSQQIIQPKWTTAYCGKGITISYDGTKIFQMGEYDASLVDARTGVVQSTFKTKDLGEFTSCFSLSGDKIAAVSRYLRRIKIWDTRTGELISDGYGGYSNTVTAAAFNKAGTRLLMYRDYYAAEVWDVQTGETVIQFSDQNQRVLRPKFVEKNVHFGENVSGDLVVIVKNNGSAELWDTDKGELKQILPKANSKQLEYSVFSTDGTKVALYSSTSIGVYSTESGELLYKDDALGAKVTVFDRTGNKLILTREDVQIINLESSAIERVVKFKAHPTYAEMNYEGDKIAVCTSNYFDYNDKNVYVWDIISDKQVSILSRPSQSELFVRFIGEGDSLITSTNYGVRVWDIYTERVLFLSETTKRTSDIKINNKYSRIVTLAEGKIEILKPEAGQKILSSNGIATLFNYKGDIIAVATSSIVLFYNENGDSLSQTERLPSESIKSIAFYNTSNKLAVVYNSGIMRVWDVNTFTLMNSYSLGINAEAIVFSPDDSKFAVAHDRSAVRVYNSENAEEITTLYDKNITEVKDCFFSSTGKYIVSVGHGQGVWSTENWNKIDIKQAFKFAINNQEDLIAGVNYDSIDVWNIRTGKHVATLKGHLDYIDNIHFDPNYNRFITYSHDQTTRLWNAVTGSQLAFLNTGESNTTYAVFNKSSSKVVTSNISGVVSEFDISGITTSVNKEETIDDHFYSISQNNNAVSIALRESVNNDTPYTLYDIMGANILSGKIASGSLSTSFSIQNLVSGSYILALKNRHNVITRKIVKIN